MGGWSSRTGASLSSVSATRDTSRWSYPGGTETPPRSFAMAAERSPSPTTVSSTTTTRCDVTWLRVATSSPAHRTPKSSFISTRTKGSRWFASFAACSHSCCGMRAPVSFTSHAILSASSPFMSPTTGSPSGWHHKPAPFSSALLSTARPTRPPSRACSCSEAFPSRSPHGRLSSR